MDFLRDPLWQFIGAFIGLLGIVTVLLIFVIQRQVKRLSYEINTNFPLIGKELQSNLAEQIRLSYKGKLAAYPRLVIFDITNEGSLPILPTDYSQPIQVSFASGSEILDTAIVKAKPDTLHPIIENDKSFLVIKPLLLNSQDAFKVKVLVDSPSPDIVFSARIVGVRKLASRGNFTFAGFYTLLVALYFLGGISGAQLLNSFSFIDHWSSGSFYVIWSLLSLAFGLVCFVSAIVAGYLLVREIRKKWFLSL